MSDDYIAERIHEIDEKVGLVAFLLQEARRVARELMRLHWRRERPTSAELADLETAYTWLSAETKGGESS